MSDLHLQELRARLGVVPAGDILPADEGDVRAEEGDEGRVTMKNPMAEPLAPAEVAAGLARLKAAPFMVRNFEQQDDSGSFHIGDAATDFIFEAAPRFSETFTTEHGIPADQEEDSIIRDLGYALVLSRVTQDEALRLFTERGDWRPVARLAS